MSWLTRIFILFFFLEPLPAAPVQYVHVFNEPNLPTPQGTLRLAELKAQTQEVISKTWDRVEWQGVRGWVRRSLLLTRWHFESHALVEQNTPLHSAPDWKIPSASSILDSSLVKIVELKEDWVKVQTQNGKQNWTGWVRETALTPTLNHWGKIYVTRTQALLRQPQDGAPPIRMLSPGTALSVEKIEGGFAKVSLNEKEQGWVRIGECLSKAQFAHQIQDHQGRWHKVLFVVNDWIQTEDKAYVSFADIRGFRLHTDRLYVFSPQASLREHPSLAAPRVSSLTRWLPLQRLEAMTVRWARSQTIAKQQGWWALNGPDGQDAAPTGAAAVAPTLPPPRGTQASPALTQTQTQRKMKELNAAATNEHLTLTSEYLFRRRVFDIASSPVIPNLLFASANGIFRSLDGKKWQQLPQFGDKNYPVAVAPDGSIYIGPYRSLDHGQSFANYVRWDRLVKAIQNITQTTSAELRLKKIEILSDSTNGLQLTLSTGHKDVKVVSENGGKSWQAVPQP